MDLHGDPAVVIGHPDPVDRRRSSRMVVVESGVRVERREAIRGAVPVRHPERRLHRLRACPFIVREAGGYDGAGHEAVVSTGYWRPRPCQCADYKIPQGSYVLPRGIFLPWPRRISGDDSPPPLCRVKSHIKSLASLSEQQAAADGLRHTQALLLPPYAIRIVLRPHDRLRSTQIARSHHGEQLPRH